MSPARCRGNTNEKELMMSIINQIEAKLYKP